MKKRLAAIAAPLGEGTDWVLLWLSHMLIPWHLPFPTLRKPPSRHREKRSKAGQPTLAGFTESSTLRKSTNYLSSG